MSYAIELFDRTWISQGAFRWLHIIAGITWIGLLYYFNLVQVPAFAKLSAPARNEAINELARRALWWFRWAALATVIFGLLITGQKDYWGNSFFKRPGGLSILIGIILGVLMFLNVWGVIWRNQKLVLQNAYNALNGADPVPGAADAGRKALLASRQNFIFSVPMLWFMVATSHFYVSGGFANALSSGKSATFIIISLIIIALLELNALGIFGGFKAGKPNLWIYESHKNAIISGFVLWGIFWILSEILFKS